MDSSKYRGQMVPVIQSLRPLVEVVWDVYTFVWKCFVLSFIPWLLFLVQDLGVWAYNGKISTLKPALLVMSLFMTICEIIQDNFLSLVKEMLKEMTCLYYCFIKKYCMMLLLNITTQFMTDLMLGFKRLAVYRV